MNATRISLFVILTILLGCKASVISHDEDQAAAQAIQFARSAFVDNDLTKAYGMLDPELQKQLSPSGFKAAVESMHSGGYPSEIQATAYEPTLGQEEMQIFLIGSSGSNQLYYRLRMVGTKSANYRVTGMYRNSAPYPTTPLRQSLGSSSDAS
jgi:hypothetical protein